MYAFGTCPHAKPHELSRQLYAKGGEDGPEYRRAHRLIGSWEFAKIARQAAELGRYVIAVCYISLVTGTPF